MNTFASTALQGLSPFELVFARKPRQLTSFELPKITSFPVEYREFFRLLLDRAKMYRDMEMEWRTLQALELRDKNKMLTNIETFQPNDLVYLLAPYSSSLQSKAQKFRQDYIGPLAIDTKLDDTHYLLKDVTGRTLPGDYHQDPTDDPAQDPTQTAGEVEIKLTQYVKDYRQQVKCG